MLENAIQNVPGFVEGAHVGMLLPRSSTSWLFTRSFSRVISIGIPCAGSIRRSVAVSASLDFPTALTYAIHLLSGLHTGKKLLSSGPLLATTISGAPQT